MSPAGGFEGLQIRPVGAAWHRDEAYVMGAQLLEQYEIAGVLDQHGIAGREQAARRAATRQNLRLEKSRMRDPRALSFGLYRLLDVQTGEVYASGDGPTDYGLDLDAVQRILDRGRR